jgi:diguanylate cyclase (GGDEF)-like protein
LSELRPSDYVGRIGGEEFAIVLPNTPLTDSLEMAERLRRATQEATISSSSGDIKLTVSIGVAQLGPNAKTIEDLLRNADVALYEAKARGRNRTIGYSQGDAIGTETPGLRAAS